MIIFVFLGFPIKLTKEPVCFSAKGNKYGTFHTTIPGQISSFRLVHVSGAVGAFPGGAGSWGTNQNRFDTIITDSVNKVISPPVSMLNGYYGYNLPNRNSRFDPELNLPVIEPPFKVAINQAIRIWFGEDLVNKSESDNYGTSCVHVYANYKDF